MDLEEELLSFLNSIERKSGKPKLDGTPRKPRVDDPAIRQRNNEIVLTYYGFGPDDLPWPTYEQLAELYQPMTRQRIEQIIARNFTDHIESPLAKATAIAKLLATREVWSETDFLEELAAKGLARRFEHAIGLMNYLHSQGIAKDYAVYLPTMKVVTRSTYQDHHSRLIARNARAKTLLNDLKAAYKIPGRAGLARIVHVKRRGAAVDHEGLKSIIRLSSNAWSGVEDGDFWYSFEDRENVLVNNAKKTFAVTDNCPLDAFADVLHNSLFRRSPTTEYPSKELVRTWITQSNHFRVEDRVVRFAGEPAELLESEEALVEVTSGNPGMAPAKIIAGLVARGVGKDLASSIAFRSPLLLVDKSGGRSHYRATLVSDLAAKAEPPSRDRYEIFRARLAKLARTDREAKVLVRMEQSLLASWVFDNLQSGQCAICQRPFSKKALVVAHKKKRSLCADSERLDPNIVFPLCIFGCDYLYEHGFVRIRDGAVIAGVSALSDSEKEAVTARIGKKLPERWAKGPSTYFR